MPVEPTVAKPVRMRGAILLPWQPTSSLAPHVLSTAGKSGLGRAPSACLGSLEAFVKNSLT
jgi:hypothetical protein